MALFGSYARGSETDKSDVDILVDLNTPMGYDIIDVLEFFEQIIPEKKIDMVTLNGVKNSRYKPYIEEDLIYV
jgi:predicted nucleotidyltransferase